jgi:hypothetical protein
MELSIGQCSSLVPQCGKQVRPRGTPKEAWRNTPAQLTHGGIRMAPESPDRTTAYSLFCALYRVLGVDERNRVLKEGQAVLSEERSTGTRPVYRSRI